MLLTAPGGFRRPTLGSETSAVSCPIMRRSRWAKVAATLDALAKSSRWNTHKMDRRFYLW
ncbi:MAG: hypothetical protein ACREN8_03930 [Candidatus Dormibacteraceae bacterium]